MTPLLYSLIVPVSVALLMEAWELVLPTALIAFVAPSACSALAIAPAQCFRPQNLAIASGWVVKLGQEALARGLGAELALVQGQVELAQGQVALPQELVLVEAH